MRRRAGRRRTSFVLVAAFLAASLSTGLVADAAPSSTGASASDEHAKRGEVYHGLRRGADNGPCKGAYEAPTSDGKTKCSHGPDPAPDGVDVRTHRSTPELAASVASDGSSPASSLLLPCYGDGTSGMRVQAIYARASDVADRFSTIAPLIPQWAAKTDAVFVNSAATTGGVRHLRYVTGAGCILTVVKVVLSTTGDDSLTNTINELDAKGYNRTDRTYLIWTDANVYCGIGTIYGDDRAIASNANNVGPSYARVDNGCWGLSMPVEAHEVMHNLGGVQLSAAHTSGGWHCTDENDRMCYPDAAGVTMTFPCAPSDEALFDCGHDDYFSTAPAANSYLATHWNAASSVFLSSAAPDAWGDPTGAPLPTPTPTPTPTPSLVTSTYTGSFGSTTTTRSYAVTAGAGTLAAMVKYNGTSLFTLRIRNSAGTLLASRTLPSPVKIWMTVPSGTYYVMVTGRSASYTLAVVRPV